jgi:hypothetical protein
VKPLVEAGLNQRSTPSGLHADTLVTYTAAPDVREGTVFFVARWSC